MSTTGAILIIAVAATVACIAAIRRNREDRREPTPPRASSACSKWQGDTNLRMRHHENGPLLFLDADTTGLPPAGRCPHMPYDRWPRLVRLAWAVADDTGGIIESETHIVTPSGFEIPDESASIHGITTRMAHEAGHDLRHVLERLSAAAGRCTAVVGHNIDFDAGVVEAELHRAGMPDAIAGKQRICTMLASVGLCAIPSDRHGMKFPRLDELYQTLFNRPMDSDDLRSTMECYFELRSHNIL